MIELQGKVTARHLKRKAYLYVRQSTLRQVLENTESTKRQYALRQRAVALGWSEDETVVIDHDLGQSGAGAADREGFQRLVTEVGMGRAGIVMGLEVSRLARNCADWHRLLEICALSDTLILDEDGVYDPSHFNDRLLLGLKGTMSEAELHVMRARLQGGLMAKARRGDLAAPLPIGFVYDHQNRVVLDPDKQIQESVRHLFLTFDRTGSATATVKAFKKEGLLFPRRPRKGGWEGPILWAPLMHSRALFLLHNPRYAGVFFYGQLRQRKAPNGKRIYKRVPPEECYAFIRDAHPGYITWEQFENHQRRLQENSNALGPDRTKSPPREGLALLQGLVICGRCGERMTIRYHQRKSGIVPDYVCQRDGIEQGKSACQSIHGEAIDEAIGTLLLETVTPLSLEVALAVQQELQARGEQADRLRYQRVERAQYEVDLSRRRYMQVTPENRLVADTLEGDWNLKLLALKEAQQEYERRRTENQDPLHEQRDRVLALANDFPRLWSDPGTPQRERKRMVRLLLEDVTLLKDHQVTAQVRFRGGASRTLTVARPQKSCESWQTPSAVVSQMDNLLDSHTLDEIAEILNGRGLHSGQGKPLSRKMLTRIQAAYGLKSRFDRLRQTGLLTAEEIGSLLGVTPYFVNAWRRQGLLSAQPYNRKSFLYERPKPGDRLPLPGG